MSDRLNEAKQAIAEMRAERDARQRSLFDTPDVDEQIENVADHAGPVWREKALAAVKAAARANLTLTAVDARYRCPDCSTYDNRAWGQVMRIAAKKGWIYSTGTYRPGPRETHGRALLVWRSNIAVHHWQDTDWQADGVPKRLHR